MKTNSAYRSEGTTLRSSICTNFNSTLILFSLFNPNKATRKHSFNRWLIVVVLIFFFHSSYSQDWKIVIKDNCNNNTDCNPFYAGFICGKATFKSTHGSPSFYANGNNKQILMQAYIASGGTQYGEGFTLNYSFKPNITYTIKIVHQGLPQTGTTPSYPVLIAALTNEPPNIDNGCAEGHFSVNNFIYKWPDIFVSGSLTTTTLGYTPSEPISFLWLRSQPQQVATAGLLISSIEIDDPTATNPTGPGPGPGGPAPCSDVDYDFCHPSLNVRGNWEVRTTNRIRVMCDAFASENFSMANQLFWRNFASGTEIEFQPGFEASATPNEPGQIRVFYAMISSDPCREDMTTYPHFSVRPPLQAVVENKPQDQKNENISLSVYPTLSAGNIRIDGSIKELQNAVISVVDQSGRVVYQKTIQSVNTPLEINLAHLSNGMYFVKVNSSNKSVTKKIIIKK